MTGRLLYTHGLLFLLPALTVSCTRTAPPTTTVAVSPSRPDQIRRQFNDQLRIARDAVAAKDLNRAGAAWLLAEFPLRTEGELFTNSERADCERQLAALRPAFDQLSEQR